MSSTSSAIKHLAWISLGSNIRPDIHLPRAVRKLARLGTVRKTSTVWQSAPVGDVDQADFCNAAALLETELCPLELKQALRAIEEKLGRSRDPLNKNAARTIDLDIALFDDLLMQTPELTLPDPDLFDRSFLAVPLAELTPEFPHPQTGQTLQEIASAAGGITSLQRRNEIVIQPDLVQRG